MTWPAGKDQTTDLYVSIVHATEHAILVEDAFDNQVWIPKSLSSVRRDVVTVPYWFAKREGLV